MESRGVIGYSLLLPRRGETVLWTNRYNLCRHRQGGFNQQIPDYVDYVSDIYTTQWSFQLA